MTPEDIKKAREIIAACEPGPWTLCSKNEHVYSEDNLVCSLEPIDIEERRKNCGATEWQINNGAFIAAARTGWPEALNEVERLQGQIRGLSKAIAENSPIELNGDELLKLRAENEQLRDRLCPPSLEHTQMLTDAVNEIQKLRAVVEAAEKCIVDETMPFYEAKEIINAWRRGK